MIFIKRHSTEGRCVTGPEDILFAGASVHRSARKFDRLWRGGGGGGVSACSGTLRRNEFGSNHTEKLGLPQPVTVSISHTFRECLKQTLFAENCGYTYQHTSRQRDCLDFRHIY